MQPAVTALGIELIVTDIDRALELFCGVLGFTLIARGPSKLVEGEMATIDAGPIVISLLHPAAAGPGTVLAERAPRLSQLVLGTTSVDDTSAVFARAAEAGLSVSPVEHGAFHVSPESVEGALGIPVAAVVTTVVVADE